MKKIKELNSVQEIEALLDAGKTVFAMRKIEDNNPTIYKIVSYTASSFTSITGCQLNKNLFGAKFFTGPTSIVKEMFKTKLPLVSGKCIGVELEFISSVSQAELALQFASSPLAKYVTVSVDGSINFDEVLVSEYAIELKILARESNVEQIIQGVLARLPNECYVNESCGLHVHLDMRSRNHKKCYTRLCKALPFLQERVHSNRLNNDYCQENEYYDFDAQVEEGERYLAINPLSYSKYKTLEVRMKEATLNAAEINDWISNLLDIVKGKKYNKHNTPFFLEEVS